jgi:membrane fusion protein (multidrug efflux system)
VAEAALPAPRSRVGLRPILIGVVAACAALTVGWWALMLRGWERTDDAFVEGHMVFLSSRVAGQVMEVHVTENQRVAKGDVLVRLDPADFEARAARARADLDAARNRMAQTHAAADAAAAQIRMAEVKLKHADQELARARELFEGRVASRTALDAAVAARDGANAALHAAQEQERAERAALGNEAPVRQAEAALREAELALQHSAVTAPFDGVVGKKNAEPGAIVSPGQPLVSLTDVSEIWVTANFKETQITTMDPGDAAEIRVDAFPDVVLRGHVESVSPATGARYALLPPDNATGNFTKVVQRVPVRIAIDAVEGDAASLPDVARTDGGTPWLPVGLSVDARVHIR